MTSTSTEQKTRPRRRFAPRFSLAAALLAMTLCAVALWYWYRVPFEVVHEATGRKEIETVRRTWDGAVRHGTRRIWIEDKLVFIENDGTRRISSKDKLFFIENYRDGIPHGKWEWLDGNGKAYLSAQFKRGRLVSFEASPECDQRLARHLAEGTIKDPQLIMKLIEPTRLSFEGTPLNDGMQVLMDAHGLIMNYQSLRKPAGYVEFGRKGEIVKIEMLTDRYQQMMATPAASKRVVSLASMSRGKGSPDSKLVIRQFDMPVTCDLTEVPLIVGLGTMLQPHDLVCDYRYGQLWIDGRESAANWKDPTGVTSIVPRAGSSLAIAWELPNKFEFIQTLFGDVCAAIEQSHNVKLDLSHMPDHLVQSGYKELPVTCYLGGLPFKHSFATLLEGIDCQARLDGETIVIELQPGHPAAAKR